MDDHWIALFSGGKDSSWAIHRALREGRSITHLVTAIPEGDSYLFHVPATAITRIAAESLSIPIRTFSLADVDPASVRDAAVQGDAELEPLAETVDRIDAELDGGLSGIVSGAVASTFQRDRLDRLADRRELEHVAPLWGCDPNHTLRRMIDAGFDIRVVAVAAAGLDRSWLGRRIDHAAFSELRELQAEHGIHLLGEGGEYETLVVDGPHMDRAIRFEAAEVWDGTRGHLSIRDAWLEPSSTPEH